MGPFIARQHDQEETETEPDIPIPANYLTYRTDLHVGRMIAGSNEGIVCNTCGWSTNIGEYDIDMAAWRTHRRITDPLGVGY